MAEYLVRALRSNGDVADSTAVSMTGPGSLGTVESLFFLPVEDDYPFVVTTPESTTAHEVRRAPTQITPPVLTGQFEAGGVLTINEGAYKGTVPINFTRTLTVDGVDVTGDIVNGTYTIPGGADPETAVYTETASNGITPDASQTIRLQSPEALLATADAGFFIDPYDTSNLYTDAAATINVANDGDDIGAIVANGVKFIPGDPAKKIRWHADGDGTKRFYVNGDAYLITESNFNPGGGQQMQVVAGLRANSYDTGDSTQRFAMLGEFNSSGVWANRWFGADRMGINGAEIAAPAVGDRTVCIWIEDRAAGWFYVESDPGQTDTNNDVSKPAYGTDQLTLFAAFNGSGRFLGNCYGLVVRFGPDLTADQIEGLRGLFRAKARVGL